MKAFCLIILSIVINRSFSQEVKPFSIGEIHTFRSEVLGENRVLNIYLPPDYKKDDTTHYPVIYLLDGSADEDFIHVAGLLQYCNFPWINLEANAILVGIANVDRRRDLTWPTNNAEDKAKNPTSGGAAKFMEFVEKEMIPYIDGKFNTSKERTIIGQSLGGLMCTQFLFEKPEIFNRYIILSPSTWWDNKSILSKTLNKEAIRGKSVYLAIGKEGPLMIPGAKKLNSMLKKAGTLKQLEFEYFPNENHATMGHIPIFNAFQKM